MIAAAPLALPLLGVTLVWTEEPVEVVPDVTAEGVVRDPDPSPPSGRYEGQDEEETP